MMVVDGTRLGGEQGSAVGAHRVMRVCAVDQREVDGGGRCARGWRAPGAGARRVADAQKVTLSNSPASSATLGSRSKAWTCSACAAMRRRLPPSNVPTSIASRGRSWRAGFEREALALLHLPAVSAHDGEREERVHGGQPRGGLLTFRPPRALQRACDASGSWARSSLLRWRLRRLLGPPIRSGWPCADQGDGTRSAPLRRRKVNEPSTGALRAGRRPALALPTEGVNGTSGESLELRLPVRERRGARVRRPLAPVPGR